MIQAVAAPHDGMVLYRSSGRSRRRAPMALYGLLAVAAVAGSGVLVSGVQDRMAREAGVASADMTPPRPFSYFPR